VNWSDGVDVFQETRTGLSERIKELREDTYGSYTVTTFDPPGQQDVLNLGVSEGKLAEAMEFFTDFVATEVLDSVSLDDHTRFQEWIDTRGQLLLTVEALSFLERNQSQGGFASVIFNNSDYSALNYDSSEFSPVSGATRVLPRLLRDGGPRVFNKKIWGLEAAPVGPGVYVRGSGTAVYTTSHGAVQGLYNEKFGCGNTQQSSYTDENGEIVWEDEVCLISNPETVRYGLLRFHVGIYLVPEANSLKIASFSNYFKIEEINPYIDDTQLAEEFSSYPEFFVQARGELRK
jgi:hypothetical protein